MDWGYLIDNSQKIAGLIAVIVGGLWIYFNSFRGRTFVPRLQVEISGKIFLDGEIRYLLVTMQTKNVGSSIVQLRGRGTGLKVVSLRSAAGVPQASNLIEEETTAFSILEKDTISEKDTSAAKKIKNIEPGTAINEQKLIIVDTKKYDAFKLELRVYALGGSLLWSKLPDRCWRATAIAANDNVSKQRETLKC